MHVPTMNRAQKSPLLEGNSSKPSYLERILPQLSSWKSPFAVFSLRQATVSTSQTAQCQRDQASKTLDDCDSWIPKALQRKSLAAFVTFYILLIIVLAVLFRYSNTHNGLASSDASLYYLWTYGPTAVFTALAALWTMVEYHSKQLAPWRSLASGPSLARQSLLLDYISPWNGKTLYSSLRAGCVDVSLSVAGGLLLKLMVVFSTGLFALEQRTILRHDVSLTTTSRFANVSGDVNAQPFLKAFAIKKYDLELPPGDAETFAYQTFNISQADLPSNTTISAAVDAFYIDLECEVQNATWTIIRDPKVPLDYLTEFEIKSPDCPYLDRFEDDFHDVHGYVASYQTKPCGFKWNSTLSTLPSQRWWIIIGYVGLDSFNYTNGDNNRTYRGGKHPVACISCQPKFEIRKAWVTTDGTITNATLIPNGTPSSLPKVSAWDLLQYSLRSSDIAHDTVYGRTVTVIPGWDNFTFLGTIFELMDLTAPRHNPEGWMDTEKLIVSSRKAFQGIATQYVLDRLSEPGNGTSSGTATYTENRIVLRALSFYLITALLAVSIVISTGLGFYRPVGVVPRDPGSIAGLAAILASSPDINESLKGTAHSPVATYIILATSGPFQSSFSHDDARRFQITSSNSNMDHIDSLPVPPPQPKKWWRPFGISPLGKVAVLLSPLAAIATLEALYQHSRRNNGIADVVMDEYSRYLWAYLPAVTVWIINVWFEGIYFLSTVIQPYHALRRGPATADEAVTENLLGKVLIHNACSAAMKRRFAVLFASLAVMLGTVLPIAVAGLYTTRDISRSTPILLLRQSQLNSSHGFLSAVDNLGFGEDIRRGYPLGNLVLYNNLSFPRWTYETFALEEFRTYSEEEPRMINTTYSSVSALVPAVRARVNCTIVPQVDIYRTEHTDSADFEYPEYTPPDYDNQTVKIISTTSRGCIVTSGIFPYGAAFYTPREGFDTGGEESVYVPTGDYLFGGFTGIYSGDNNHWFMPGFNDSQPSPFSPFYTNTSVSDVRYHGNSAIFPLECPRAVVTFGKSRFGNGTDAPPVHDVEEVTVMHCWPYVEQVVLNTTFSLPDLDIKSAVPLPPDPDIKGGYPFFSEAEIAQVPGFTPYMNYLTSVMNISDSSVGDFNLFMEAVIWGKDGIPSSELLGKENAERLLARVERVYGIIMAQLYNTEARIPAASDAAPLNGTAMGGTRFRLFQNLISTRILESVLAAMFVCVALSFFLLDTDRLLPQNPCSIAGAASLLAGSALVERSVMPEGAEFMSEKDMRQNLKGLKFLLGWWGQGDGKRFGIDIVDGVREKHQDTPAQASSTSASATDVSGHTDGDVSPMLPEIPIDSTEWTSFLTAGSPALSSADITNPPTLAVTTVPSPLLSRANSTTSALSVTSTSASATDINRHTDGHVTQTLPRTPVDGTQPRNFLTAGGSATSPADITSLPTSALTTVPSPLITRSNSTASALSVRVTPSMSNMSPVSRLATMTDAESDSDLESGPAYRRL